MLDKEQRLSLSRMNVGGIWGRRLKDSVNAWTLKMSDDVLLDCFRKRPGVQAFIGEHVGKYVDGAILDNLITDCPELWEKVDRLLRELITHQEEDGYLGTYLPHTRWLRYPGEESCSWDPWVAKYTLLALARYYEMTHDEVFSNCALRLLKLLIEIYGENGKYDLNLSDAQAGLASGSILEAVLKWYEISGKEELLGFAERIVIYYWSEQAPNTPHLLEHMTQLPYGLKTVGHGKAYEMMSCFVGLVEFSRLTGRREYLDKVIVARDHIASQYKQINGCMSEREWFTRAKNFSEMADLENCVAFTWIQLNSRLFEMTGDIRCIDYIEETMWNHICQSICPDASTWIYYTTLIGPKDYSYWSQLPSSPGMTEMMSIHGFSYDYTEEQLTTQYESAPITCCHSNGQRALGLVPQYAVTVTKAGKLSINLLMELKKTLDIDGNTVDIEIKTDFPRSGSAKLVIECERPVEAMVRIPYWTDHAMLNGSACEADAFEPLSLNAGRHEVALELHMPLRLLNPGYVNRGKFAIAKGPLLYAIDELPSGWDWDDVALRLDRKDPLSALRVEMENGWPLIHCEAYRTESRNVQLHWKDVPMSFEKQTVTLRPFIFAGIGKNVRFAQCYEDTTLSYDVEEPLTEYRVMYPCFFV